jgi:hypothetical protein
MPKKHNLPDAVARLATTGRETTQRLTPLEHVLHSLDTNDTPFVALKYYQPDHQCLSDWRMDELKAFSDFIRKLKLMTWADIYRSGGAAGAKHGLGYTVHKDRSNLPSNAELETISPDIQFFELRISHKARVHGFRSKNTFFLVWLDRNHEIYPA